MTTRWMAENAEGFRTPAWRRRVGVVPMPPYREFGSALCERRVVIRQTLFRGATEWLLTRCRKAVDHRNSTPPRTHGQMPSTVIVGWNPPDCFRRQPPEIGRGSLRHKPSTSGLLTMKRLIGDHRRGYCIPRFVFAQLRHKLCLPA
jgi:hypothetical protein